MPFWSRDDNDTLNNEEGLAALWPILEYVLLEHMKSTKKSVKKKKETDLFVLPWFLSVGFVKC